MNLSLCLKETAKKFPDKTAIYFNEDRLTFKQLDDSAGKFASALSKSGVSMGNRVGALLRNCPAYIIAVYGILRNGSILVPINTFLTPSEIQFILDDSKIKCLITSKEFLPVLQGIRSGLPYLEKVIAVDIEENITEDVYSAKVLMKSQPREYSQDNLDEDIEAVFFYTSGTTGIPKAAMLTHKNLISDINSSKKAISITPDDSFLLALPIFHSFCMTVNVLLPVYNGSSIVMVESVRSFENLLKAIITCKPTIFAGVPQIFSALTAKPLSPEIIKNIPLRLCISGSAPLAEKTLNSFQEKFGIPLVEGYGLSEAAPVVSLNPLDKERKPNSVGLPLPDIDVKIIGDDGTELPPNEAGEILIRGNNVMKGYYNRPEETDIAIRDGWLYTGDIGYKDKDGYIYIIDRKKDLIISKGMKIYPREIEALLYQYPKVEDAAVISRKDERKNESPLAFIVLKENETATSREILDFLKSKIAGYKIPREIIFVKDLPKTATGKILKRELKAV